MRHKERKKVKNSCRAAGIILFIMMAIFILPLASPSRAGECQDRQSLHPEWIFCDDFEGSVSLTGQGRYFEYDDAGGAFTLAGGVGLDGSKGMRAVWQQGVTDAGSLKLGFGRNPSGGMNTGIRSTENFREVYYRMYLRMQDGWQGNPGKLSRATVITAGDWSQAMIAHLWNDDADHLLIDPVRCVDSGGTVRCVGYNDFPNMVWLGSRSGVTPLFDAAHDNRWYCIEAHVRLNDSGQSNGVQEFWIDGSLEARRDALNFVGAYTAYGINALFFENYWNAGSPQKQERYIDNIVVSTMRIGCMDTTAPRPPVNVKAQ
ncbi:MAG: hypothetical protein U0411_12805 [Thermodesulfovibrionales bacterium]